MHASAFVIGPNDGPGLALEELGAELDFRAMRRYTNLSDATEQTKTTPICFFLFSAGLDPDAIADAARAVRTSRNRQLRFAPMITFSETPSQQAILSALQLGFDDILLAPFTSARVKPRLQLLLSRKITFYETSTYFGPDRRTQELPWDQTNSERGKGGAHRRIEIIRDLNIGVRIVTDQKF